MSLIPYIGNSSPKKIGFDLKDLTCQQPPSQQDKFKMLTRSARKSINSLPLDSDVKKLCISMGLSKDNSRFCTKRKTEKTVASVSNQHSKRVSFLHLPNQDGAKNSQFQKIQKEEKQKYQQIQFPSTFLDKPIGR